MKKILSIARCILGCVVFSIGIAAFLKAEPLAAIALLLISLLVLLPVAHLIFGKPASFLPDFPTMFQTEILWSIGFVLALAGVGGLMQKENDSSIAMLVLGLMLISPLPDIAFMFPELRLWGKAGKSSMILTAGITWSGGLMAYFLGITYFFDEADNTTAFVLSGIGAALLLLHPVVAFLKHKKSVLSGGSMLAFKGNEKAAQQRFVLLQPLLNVKENEYLQVIHKGESSTVEFKSTLRVDVRTNKVEKFIQHSVLKTIAAFLNSQGGTLVIGVDDGKNIIGLEADFNSFSKPDKFDEYQKYLDTLLGSTIGNRFQRYLQVEFPSIEGKVVCIITVKSKSAEPVYIINDAGQEAFYIRRLASTIDLKTSEAIKYIREHW